MDALVRSHIEQAVLTKFSSKGKVDFSPVGGGCINETYRVSTNGEMFFCKINSATKFPHLFEAERKGLVLIANSHTIRVPEVVDVLSIGEKQVLLMEWIKEGERTEAFWKNFGEQLAALHACSNTVYGLSEDNYMGSVVQQNKPHGSWIDFFIHQRLQPVLQQCMAKGLISSSANKKFETLYTLLPSLFPVTKPALVHGDLWSGNFMCDENSHPVLIDPASYFGHPSVDLAMSTLFGGFRSGFYESYNYYSPLPSNYREQWTITNLYPLLIHLLLFGRSYLPQIESTLQQFA